MAEGTSVLVRAPVAAGLGFPVGGARARGTGGEPMSTRCSFRREQPAPVPHGGGGQPDGAPDRRGEAQPRAGGPAHAQVGVPRAPGPRGPRRPPACLPSCPLPSPLWPRYEELAESVEEYVLDMLRDQLNRRQPIDSVSRNHAILREKYISQSRFKY